MTIREYCAALEAEGRLLAAAAQAGPLGAAVPTCPGWRVRDLLRHVGFVHRWAARYVAEALPAMVEEPGEAAILRAGSPDQDLVAWFGAGHAALVATLRAAPVDLRCWTFLPAPSPLTFWARRQTHETAIHRVDVQLAVGALSPMDPVVAADGIDELVMGFAGRSGRLDAEPGRSIAVHATDTAADWSVRVGAGGRLTVARGPAEADTTLSGPAADLYLTLWNRREPGGLDLRGDTDLLARWRDDVHVTWS